MKIEVNGLSFAYPRGGFRLDGVSFAVGSAEAIESGEAVAITGRNGSGKTTLGKLLCGLLKQESGTIRFDGQNTSGWTLAQRGRRIGYLFQEPARQLFAATALEDLTFTQELAGASKKEAKERAMQLLARFELECIAGQGVHTLSRGEQQRLAIRGLLLQKPGALVLDEPTTGLDARRKAVLAEALHECLRSGVSVLLISHDTGFVRANAQRELRLEGGRLVA